MAASPALPNAKVSSAANHVPAVAVESPSRGCGEPCCRHPAGSGPVVRTTVHAIPTGVGSRSTRRRTTPEAGFALEVLGHAIEYLADEYAHEAGSLSSIYSQDPRVEAMQLLMAANRQVYYACPLVPSLYERTVGRIFGR